MLPHASTPCRKSSFTPLVILLLTATIGVARAAAPPAPPEKPKKDKSETFFTKALIPLLHIDISPADLAALKKENRAYVHATIRESLPGQPERTYKDVGLHLKGGPGSFRPVEDRPALTLEFNKFTEGQKFHGLHQIHLNNSVQDPTLMCENLCGAISRAAGIPAARATNARVWLNDRELGFYVLKEGFDDVFLTRFFNDATGTFYEGSFIEIDQRMPTHPKRDGKEQAKIKELAAAANEPNPALRRQRLDKVLDVDRFITFMALEAMIGHWDGYCGNRNNYRIYLDPKSDKLVFIPHGMDQVFQNPSAPMWLTAGLVARALTETPEDRKAYMDRVAKLQKSVFAPAKLSKRLDKISAHILPEMERISPDAARQHKANTAELHERLTARAKSIERQLNLPSFALKFDATNQVSLSDWEVKPLLGQVLADKPSENGKPLLHLRCEKGGGTSSWRTTVVLLQGRYTFEGQLRAAGVVPAEAPNPGLGLRVSGEQRKDILSGDLPWQKSTYDFEVTDPAREVVLICELKATQGEAWFDASSLKLRRR